MAVVIASDLHKDMAGRPLLGGVSFKLERRDRMTIAGRNGAGKTTLLRMLAGEESIDRGELVVGKGVRMALHDQRPPRYTAEGGHAMSLRDYLLSGCSEELQIEAQLAELEAGMAAGATVEAMMARYAAAQARLDARGGYLWRDRATSMARGLGFADDDLPRSLDTFSGGQLTRASLARALAVGADVLLLDEPTNHLDIESLQWLEQTLVGLDASIVLVAHDRWFLEAVGTSVLELETGPTPRSRYFAGTWSQWRTERAARDLALGRAIDRQRAEIARIEQFVERFRYKATKARQAQSRMKRLAKIDRIERDPKSARVLEFDFKTGERSGRVIFECEDLRIEVGEPPLVLLEDAELWLERGEHVSLVGPNGAGKTTLIETLAGIREPTRGRIKTGHNVKVGYLSQHAEDLGAGGGHTGRRDGSGQTVLDATQRATGLSPNPARALLGRFLFSGEQVDKPLDGLSGGERRRLSLAVVVGAAQPPNVLILDEPTNHLDIESREALEDALRAFSGSLLLVSHDRALLDAVGSRTIAIEDRTLHNHMGGWQEYSRAREERRLTAADTIVAAGGPSGAHTTPSRSPHPRRDLADRDLGGRSPANGTVQAATVEAGGLTPASQSASPTGRSGSRGRGVSKNRLSAQERAERAVEEAEAAMRSLEEELSDPASWATKYETAKSQARHTAAKRAVEEAYARLESLLV